jgi:hypothetical protein
MLRFLRLASHLFRALPVVWLEAWLTLWAEIDSEHNVKYGHEPRDDGYAGDAVMRELGGSSADSGGGD